jgi:hypothetical protein
MRKITALFVGLGALAAISTTAATVAEAAGGCGKGYFFDGQRCMPKGEPGYRPHYGSHHYPPHYGSHHYPPHYGSHHGGVHIGLGSGVHLHLGGY